MTENYFYNNSALNGTSLGLEGYGGGLYYTCATDNNCKLLMYGNNTFESNYAENAGGGIKWDDVEPSFKDGIFYSNNSATLYGDNIACFAQMLIEITED